MSGPLSFSANNSYPCIVPPNGPTGTTIPVLISGPSGPKIVGLLADQFTPPLYDNSNGSYDITTGIFTFPNNMTPRVFDITSNMSPVISSLGTGSVTRCSVYVLRNEFRSVWLDFLVDPTKDLPVTVGPIITAIYVNPGDKLSLGMLNNSTATLYLAPGALTFSVSGRKI